MEATAKETRRYPALAILTMPDTDRPFRGNHFNFIDLIRKGKELGAFVYVVTPHDLRAASQRIFGYLYDPESNTWSRRLLPFPQVVYNRIPNRQDEQQPEAQLAIQTCLLQGSTRLFNPFFFDKWTLFEWLNHAKTTRVYIPTTQKLSASAKFEAFLRRYPFVYLKPAGGKAGKGIMKIEVKGPLRNYRCKLSIQNDKQSRVTVHASLADLWARVKQQIEDGEYIVQQGIRLAQSGGRPFDLRVLVQKNGWGKWDVTGVGARVAGKRSITTHVPRGGRIDEPESLLSASFGAWQTPQFMRNVKTAALSIARQIEKASGHTFGEMSMDLGIDQNGRIWFFEANSHPMKFDEPDIRDKSLERIIQYSLYLCKQRKKRR